MRKVLGASARAIVQLLSKDFARLVGIAALIAFPIAWYVMSKWLGRFAYRITISWWIFLLAGVSTLIIALITVGAKAFRAALINPAISLRSE